MRWKRSTRFQQDMAAETEAASLKTRRWTRCAFRSYFRPVKVAPKKRRLQVKRNRRNFKELVQAIQTIQQQSNEAMVSAVEDEDLDVQRYNQIAQAVQQDQELMQRLQFATDCANSPHSSAGERDRRLDFLS